MMRETGAFRPLLAAGVGIKPGSAGQLDTAFLGKEKIPLPAQGRRKEGADGSMLGQEAAEQRRLLGATVNPPHPNGTSGTAAPGS